MWGEGKALAGLDRKGQARGESEVRVTWVRSGVRER